jgi:endogenous inhibitor of DNA gyrase (YacG/DUF329 family)
MRSLDNRLAKLEALRPPSRNCSTCGYPATAKIRVVLTEHSDPLATCPTCGQPRDADGAPLHTPFRRIILHPGGGHNQPNAQTTSAA